MRHQNLKFWKFFPDLRFWQEGRVLAIGSSRSARHTGACLLQGPEEETPRTVTSGGDVDSSHLAQQAA